MKIEHALLNNRHSGYIRIPIYKIPDDFKIDENKAYLKKVGNALYLIPFHNSWHSLFDSVNEYAEDFMNEREQPGKQTIVIGRKNKSFS